MCGAGLEAGGWPVGAGPGLGTEGPLLLGPARPDPRERPPLPSFEKCLDRAAPGPRPGLPPGGSVPPWAGGEACALGLDGAQ